ncbi:MAG: hypothetical protein H7233_09930 [Pseudorhodobacter sp.]|nr:hypothetical protein [Frankiaceae bacterium]
MALHEDLLGGLPPTLLPNETEARTMLEAGDAPSAVAARFRLGHLVAQTPPMLQAYARARRSSGR